MVKVPEREALVVLAATEYVTVPEPVPDAPLVMVIQLVLLVAVQDAEAGVAVTFTLLIAVGKSVNVLQGIVQAVSLMGARVGIAVITVPFAVMLSLSIAGIGSAWMGGSARIPFVAGLDSYMPSWLGRIHPRYATPYAALIVQGIVSAVLVILNFAGAGVQETFQKLLSLAVVLQLVPFLYMFAALVKFAITEAKVSGQYGRVTMFIAGLSGLLTTILGIALVFFPAQQITSLWQYELWMAGGTLFFIGLATFFFFVYGRHKMIHRARLSTGDAAVGAEQSSAH